MRALAISLLLLTGCIPRSLIMEPTVDEFDDDDEEEEDAPIASPPVTPMHWACCSDLCKGWKRVASVSTEPDSPYINCECKNKKKFRVTRTWPRPK